MNLDFLYYQRKLILEGNDPKEQELKPLVNTFYNYMATQSLSDIVKVIIASYKEQYSQHKFYISCFYDPTTSWETPKYPDHLGLDNHDFYLSKDRMTRNDIEHILLRIFTDDHTKTNTNFLEELELIFTNPQNDLGNTIQESLVDKEFTVSESTNKKTFIVSNSAISEIELTDKKFIMRINTNKWKAYY